MPSGRQEALIHDPIHTFLDAALSGLSGNKKSWRKYKKALAEHRSNPPTSKKDKCPVDLEYSDIERYKEPNGYPLDSLTDGGKYINVIRYGLPGQILEIRKIALVEENDMVTDDDEEGGEDTAVKENVKESSNVIKLSRASAVKTGSGSMNSYTPSSKPSRKKIISTSARKENISCAAQARPAAQVDDQSQNPIYQNSCSHHNTDSSQRSGYPAKSASFPRSNPNASSASSSRIPTAQAQLGDMQRTYIEGMAMPGSSQQIPYSKLPSPSLRSFGIPTAQAQLGDMQRTYIEGMAMSGSSQEIPCSKLSSPSLRSFGIPTAQARIGDMQRTYIEGMDEEVYMSRASTKSGLDERRRTERRGGR